MLFTFVFLLLFSLFPPEGCEKLTRDENRKLRIFFLLIFLLLHSSSPSKTSYCFFFILSSSFTNCSFSSFLQHYIVFVFHLPFCRRTLQHSTPATKQGDLSHKIFNTAKIVKISNWCKFRTQLERSGFCVSSLTTNLAAHVTFSYTN